MRKSIGLALLALTLTACGGQSAAERQREINDNGDYIKEYIRCSDPETGQLYHDRYDDCPG